MSVLDPVVGFVESAIASVGEAIDNIATFVQSVDAWGESQFGTEGWAGIKFGAAALGSPVNCVAWLANTLGRFGIGLNCAESLGCRGCGGFKCDSTPGKPDAVAHEEVAVAAGEVGKIDR